MDQKQEIRILGIKLFEKRSSTIDRILQDNWRSSIFGTGTATGKLINETNSNTISAIWACKALLSNTFAMVPLNVYQKDGDSRVILEKDPINILIHRSPNSYMTAFTWRRTVMMQAATSGNSYTIIHRNANSGKPVALELIQNPKDVQPYLIDGVIWYKIRNVKLPVPGQDMIHFKWNGDGIEGKSPMVIAAENISQAIAIQEYGSKIFSSGGSKKVALKTPAKLNEEQKESMRKIWDKKFGGVENLHELAFLDGGSDLIEVGMNPAEAQMVEIMKFKIEEICRIYNVPLHLVQSLDQATNNNIEHQGIQYVIYTMMPHFVNFETELDFKLFPSDPSKYTRHNTNALMRGDMKTEAEYFGKMTDIGVYSINDIKRIKDENPIDNGDEHYVQVNRTTIENLNEQVPSTVDNAIRSLVEETIKNKNGQKIESN